VLVDWIVLGPRENEDVSDSEKGHENQECLCCLPGLLRLWVHR